MHSGPNAVPGRIAKDEFGGGGDGCRICNEKPRLPGGECEEWRCYWGDVSRLRITVMPENDHVSHRKSALEMF